MRTVILLPWMDGDERRQAALVFTLQHLAGYEWPIQLGGPSGEWNRAEAINEAAKGPWDVAVIVDGDTIHEPGIIERATETVSKRGGAVVPWQTRYKLNPEGSARLMREGVTMRTAFADLDHDDPTPKRMTAIHRGGPIVVGREAWETVGGFDEGFRGWGHEDVAFRLSVRALSRLRDQRGTIWHLWHPRNEPSPENNARKARYEAAAHDPEQLRRIRA